MRAPAIIVMLSDEVSVSIDRALNPKALNGTAPSPVTLTYLGNPKDWGIAGIGGWA